MVLIALFVASLAIAQSIEEFFAMPLPSDPEVISGELPNGFRYHIKANHKPEKRVAFRLLVDVGSIVEDEDQLGLAHFTEHMAFNGTANFSRTELRDYLNSIGMGFAGGLNAGTSQDFTVYQLGSRTDDMEQLRKSFKILSDWAYQISFQEAELESERGIIIEEWRMGQGSSERLYSQTSKVLFAGSRYAERNPIGTYEVLNSFPRDAILRFYKDWYRPDMQQLIIVGDVDPDQLIPMIEEYFSPMKMPENPRERETYPIPGHIEPRAVVATDSEAPYISLNLYWKHELSYVNNFGEYFENLRRLLFTRMLNSRLDEIAKKADPPYSSAYNYYFNMTQSRAVYILGATVQENNINKALEVLLAEAERANRFGFSLSELERAKQNILRATERQMLEKNTQLSDQLVWRLVSRIRTNNAMLSPEQEYQIMSIMLPQIDLDMVNAVARELITDENMTITLTGPDKKDLVYPTTDALLATYSKVNAMELDPYEDDAIDEPLLAQIPKPGKIRKEKVLKDSGFKLWTLSNGIKVYAKKTDFKEDAVSFVSRKPGGFGLYPVQDLPSAKNAGAIVANAGFGNFDQTQLMKALSGKVAGVGFGIDRITDSISGNTSPQDMELMFQMLWQYIHSPRKDRDSFDSYIARTLGYMENMALSPDAVFMDSAVVFFSGNNPYLLEDNIDSIRRINFDRSYQIFNERFSDFSGANFVFVGNFDEDKLKSMCKTYLANLPVARKKALLNYLDNGAGALRGLQSKTINVGKDPKSQYYSIISGDFAYSSLEALKLSAFNMILSERLHERIREQMSGVYVIQSYASVTKYPKQEFQLAIYMACSPERLDELHSEIMVILDELKSGNITEEDITFIKNTLIRRYEQRIITNDYWQYSTMANITNDDPHAFFLKFPELYNQLSVKDMKDMASKYLIHNECYMRAIQMPELPKQ